MKVDHHHEEDLERTIKGLKRGDVRIPGESPPIPRKDRSIHPLYQPTLLPHSFHPIPITFGSLMGQEVDLEVLFLTSILGQK